MQFTLIYQGDLPPSGKASDKWRIRRQLEPQLRTLWKLPPLSAIAKYQDPTYLPATCYVGVQRGDIEFVPLVSEKLKLQVRLDILLLSESLPGGVINRAGDIDNRLKTLFDALSVPQSSQEVPPDPETNDDRRVFCLLGDDRLVIDVRVSNDKLLYVPEHSRQSLVIIRVHPVASEVTNANLAVAV